MVIVLLYQLPSYLLNEIRVDIFMNEGFVPDEQTARHSSVQHWRLRISGVEGGRGAGEALIRGILRRGQCYGRLCCDTMIFVATPIRFAVTY